MSYVVGDSVRISVLFKNLELVATNPTTALLTVQKPDGTDTTPSVTNSGTGAYYGDVALDQAGVWRYRWAGSGAVAAAQEGAISVAASRVI